MARSKHHQRRSARTKTVLLAAGVIDKEPDLPNLFNALQKGLIRHCGICDGYNDHNSRRSTVVLNEPPTSRTEPPAQKSRKAIYEPTRQAFHQ